MTPCGVNFHNRWGSKTFVTTMEAIEPVVFPMFKVIEVSSTDIGEEMDGSLVDKEEDDTMTSLIMGTYLNLD